MDILFRRGKCTSEQVLAELPDPPGYSAVRALLATLEQKGLATHSKSSRKYVYEATVPEKRAKRRDAARDPILTLSLLLLLAVFPILALAMPKVSLFPAPPAIPSGSGSFPWPHLLCGIWFAGSAIQLGRLLSAASHLRRWRRHSTEIEHREGVEIRVLAGLSGPVASGTFRKVIFVPEDWFRWPASRRELVITHEMAHHRRSDPFWRLCAELIRGIHWYHPLVHWMTKRYILQCEYACDLSVIRSGANPREYAHTLCDIARKENPSAFAPAMASPSSLEQRVKHIFESTGQGKRAAVALSAMDPTPMKPKFIASLLSAALIPASGFSAEVPDKSHFKVETLAKGLTDAMEIAVIASGDIFITERTGALKWFSPDTGEVKLVKQFDVSVKQGNLSRETGLLGITAHPQFMNNGWIYVYYSPREEEIHRLSRFTFRQGEVSDEKIMLEIAQTRKSKVCHEGGSLAFDSAGNLFLSTGDNTNPFEADGYPPLDEREGREQENSQRTAGNTNDLRGKILRITPTEDGGYSIPDGNLFPEGAARTRPEIFVMGCRNPWRIGIDQRTNTLYWGDVGPDARKPGPRGPKGYCEINQASTAGNYGWPYFIADNKAYTAFDFETNELGAEFSPEAPRNRSRLNTGLEALPPATAPLWFENRSCYCAGPVYYHADYPENPAKLPQALDSCLITYDWNNGHMQLTKLDETGRMVWKENFLEGRKFIHPSDVELGADGAMYVLEYGSGWYDSKNGKLKKITYSSTALADAEDDAPDPRLDGLDMKHPGTALLAEATCLSCHQTQNQSVGPRYLDVADRYKDVAGAEKTLIEKIRKGGSGAWGEIPMPPHPQYNGEQLSQMVDAILSLDTGGHKE
eukprot:g3516.t1